MTNHPPRTGASSTTTHARRGPRGTRHAVVALALLMLAGLAGCAHTGPPADDAPAVDAETFAALSPGDQLALAGDRVTALRTTLARVSVRIETLRDAVRTRDALADWGQLVCLEERVPEVQGYARRGERAWDALREAVRTGDGGAVWTRFELLRLARLGVSKELAAARACGTVVPGPLASRPVVHVRAVEAREADPSSVLAHGATAREVDTRRELPAVFVPTSGEPR